MARVGFLGAAIYAVADRRSGDCGDSPSPEPYSSSGGGFKNLHNGDVDLPESLCIRRSIQAQQNMTIRLNEVTTQALHLSADDRITLIEAIMRSLEVDGPNTEQGWSQDIKDRISAFRLSGIETVDFGDYLRKYEVK